MHRFAKAVFVIGPTASGKTGLAHALSDLLSQQFSRTCELVNLDAFQFYRGVTIGTAKPPAEEINRYKYHGIDVLAPCETIDAARYAEMVWDACNDIDARGCLPICVGGSGLYLRAVLHGLDPLPPRNEDLRNMFRASAAVWGWPELHRWLGALAPERAAELHPNDKTRIERALEVVFQRPEGTEPAALFKKSQPLSQQSLCGDAFVIQVDCEDEVLRARISRRLEVMFAEGWIAEVADLMAAQGEVFKTSQAFKAIGYPEIWAALAEVEGNQARLTEKTLLQLHERIATLTWQYVRRQRTWNSKEHCNWTFDSSGGISQKFQLSDQFVDFIS